MARVTNYKLKLISNINSVSTLDQRVNDNLIKQVEDQKNIDKKKYDKAFNKLPKIVSNLEKYYQKIDLVNKLFVEFKKDPKNSTNNRLILSDGRCLPVGGAKTKTKAIENIVLGKN